MCVRICVYVCVRPSVYVCVYVCMRAWQLSFHQGLPGANTVCVRVRACTCACVYVCVCVRARECVRDGFPHIKVFRGHTQTVTGMIIYDVYGKKCLISSSWDGTCKVVV